jgi:subtilisin family serine protease
MLIANNARAALPRANACGCLRRASRSASNLIVAGVTLAMFIAGPPRAEAQTGSNRPQRILVKPKGKGGANAAVNAIHGSRVKRVFPQVGDLQVLELPAGLPAQTAVNVLRQSKDIAYAELDHVLKLHGTTPNDERYASGELWGLHNVGIYGGTPGADIKAADAWDIRTSAANVIVALVDSGVRLTHQDIAPNLWRNPREIPGNGIDDDGNGVIDDVHGFNAWLENGNPTDDLGHGTHVAGTIGAVGNNSVGVVGVAWKVQLMVTKFTDPTGNGTISDAIECIDYVRRMGAHVINASWGATWFDSTALRDAIASARDAGIIFVTVSANGHGSNNDTTPVYPGGYELDNIVVATATDRNDQLAFFANYGPKTVDLGAPGYNIFSAWIGSDTDYQYYDGGSMATAHVSGAIALVRAHFPGEDYRKIIQRVLNGTDPLPSLAGKTVTGGRLNLFKALGGSVAPPAVAVAATDAAAAESGSDPAVFTFTRSGATTAPLRILYSIGGTATNGGDYQSLAGAVTIPVGAASATVMAQPLDDTQFEENETVTLTLTPDGTYVVSTASATATIADNDRPPEPPRDTTPPVIASLTPSTQSLWPANHKMVAVTLTASVTDNADRAPTVRVVSVASNEPVNGTGDGDTAPDWAITGPMAVELRAERAGGGSGRVYTITVEARDAAGNVARRSATVTVAKDKSGK